MTKLAKPKAQAPKGQNNSAQGNALGNAIPEDQSPEPERGGDRSPTGDRVAVNEVNQRARQISSATHNNGWQKKTLGAVITSIDTGKSFRCEERPPIESEVGVVKVSAVTWGTYDEEESKTCLDAARVEPRYLIEEGDFLFSRANTIQLIGACVIAGATSRQLMLSDKILRFRFTDEVEPKWVLHWLRSKHGRSEIERLSSGNQESMRNIGQERIRAISLPLPLPDDQRRIVAEIEKQFTRLEAGVAALRRVQANLKRYRAAVLKAACEGRLVPTEAELARAEDRPVESGQQLLVRILTERRQNCQGRGKYKEPDAPDTSDLPQLPGGWAWSSLSQTAAHITDGTHKTPTYVETGVPFLSAKDISGFHLSFDKCRYVPQSEHEEMSKRCSVRRGNVLITKSGTIGRVAVVETDDEFSLFESVANVPVITPMNPKFVSFAAFVGIAGVFGAANQKGVAVRHLHLEDLRRVPIPLPPLGEQTRIVAEVERRLSVVEELEAVVTTNLQRATRLRQSILQKAFTNRS